MAVEVRGLLSGLLGAPSTTSALVNQDRTILGPLTTTFTPPASCTLAATSGSSDDLQGYIARTCGVLQSASDYTSCWPGTSKGAPKPSSSFAGWGFYSPGVVCPAGYATACLATGGASGTSDWDVQFTLSAGETAAGCCPSGYTCGNNGGQTCSQVVSTGTVSTLSCPLLGDAKTGVLTMSDGSKSDDVATMTLFAPMIQINWQSTDRAAATSASAQTSPSSTQPVKTTSSAPTTSASTTSLSTASASSNSASETPSGTQVISTESSATGALEVAPSTSSIQLPQGLDPEPTATPTAAVGANSGEAVSSSGSGTTTTNEQSSDSESTKAHFPVAATISISVAGGLGMLAVSVWACFMYQRRRRYRKDMLQGISDDRMLQQMDDMYESTRPKTFDVIGSEVPYELKRQDGYGSSSGGGNHGGGGGGGLAPPDMVYGPGQETARYFRSGPQRSPQVIGNFAGVTTGHAANANLGGDLKEMGALDPDYDRYNYRR